MRLYGLVITIVSAFVIVSGCAWGARSEALTDELNTVGGTDTDRDNQLTKTLPRSRSKARDRRPPIQWHVVEPPTGNHVVIGRDAPWCPAIPRWKPRIQPVRKSAEGKRIVVTAFLTHRVPVGCGAVEKLVYKTVFFDHPIGQRELYDGSQSPPAKRWPRSQ